MFRIKKREMKPIVQHAIRFDENLHQKLCKLAEKENVSFNFLVLECCYYALSEMSNTLNSKEV